jgi:hypothetical protein
MSKDTSNAAPVVAPSVVDDFQLFLVDSQPIQFGDAARKVVVSPVSHVCSQGGEFVQLVNLEVSGDASVYDILPSKLALAMSEEILPTDTSPEQIVLKIANKEMLGTIIDVAGRIGRLKIVVNGCQRKKMYYRYGVVLFNEAE